MVADVLDVLGVQGVRDLCVLHHPAEREQGAETPGATLSVPSHKTPPPDVEAWSIQD